MFWKILELICLVLIFLRTMKRVKDIVANLMYVYTINDETLARNYRGNFQRGDLASLNWINLTMNILLTANIVLASVFLMNGHPFWLNLRMTFVNLAISLITIVFVYGSNSSAYEIVSPYVIKAKTINDFSGDERDLYRDTQKNIEQTYILLFMTILVLILTIFV